MEAEIFEDIILELEDEIRTLKIQLDQAEIDKDELRSEIAKLRVQLDPSYTKFVNVAR